MFAFLGDWGDSCSLPANWEHSFQQRLVVNIRERLSNVFSRQLEKVVGHTIWPQLFQEGANGV